MKIAPPMMVNCVRTSLMKIQTKVGLLGWSIDIDRANLRLQLPKSDVKVP
jgi:hypothetical protein